MQVVNRVFQASIALLLTSAVLAGCSPAEEGPQAEKFVETREVMGTLATITVIAKGGKEAVDPIEAAFDALERVNGLMSTYRADSDISRLNRAGREERVAVSAETFDVLARALEGAALSDGAFDVTVGPVIGLWRQAAQDDQVPGAEEIEAALARVGATRIGLDATRHEIWFGAEGMRVDLGGIAKGHGIDQAVVALQEAGIKAGLVEVGGDLRCFGEIPKALIGQAATLPVRTLRRKTSGPIGESSEADDPETFFPGLRRTDPQPSADGQPWPLGLQSPFGEELLGKINVPAGAVATSGHYRRHALIGGRQYSHIIDPRTGSPVSSPASVTVIAPDAITADLLATAITVLGREPGLALADSLQGVEVAIVEGSAEDPILHTTGGFPNIEPLKGH